MTSNVKQFAKKHKRPIIGIVSLGIAGGLLFGGGGTALSYFSDFQSGNLGGTVGSIKGAVSTDNLAFDNLLPGDLQTVSATQANIGKNPQDVWVVFTNPDALAALNDLGTYGEFHISANGVPIFDSANLNDNKGGHCGPISPSGCWPVATEYKLASNVAPGDSTNYSFSFAYASKLSGQTPTGGGVWNSYPLGAPTSSGLPYKIVEEQVGVTP